MTFPIFELLEWYESQKRDLPWRKTKDPYKIWVSEVFLQQTQVSRVIFYYERFLEKFPNIESLANSNWEEFFPYFQGLGYYSRGKNMLYAVQYIQQNFCGVFPKEVEELQKIKGIGKYTASAIASFAYGKNVPAVDTNFIRVLSRFFNIKKGEVQKTAEQMFKIVKIPDISLLNHAIMDIGATICTAQKTDCSRCPLQKKCYFFKNGQEIVPRLPARPRRVIQQEYAILVLYQDGKYFFQNNAETKNKKAFLSFPQIIRPTGKNIRHLLQEEAIQKWNIHISVRPPFFTTDIPHANTFLRLSFSRAQIVSGNLLHSAENVWISPKNLEENRYDTYSLKVIEKLKTMKIPSPQ